MKIIKTNDKLSNSAHYSQAVVHQGILYISGQLPIDPQTGLMCNQDIESATKRVLENIELILKETGYDRRAILKTTAYIPDIDQWAKVNDIYADFFGDHKPARTVVPTRNLHYDAKIEIDAIAAVSPNND